MTNKAFQQRLYLLLGGQLIPAPVVCKSCGGTVDTQLLHASTCTGQRGDRNARHQMLKTSIGNAITWLNNNVIKTNEPYMQLGGFTPKILLGILRDSKADTKFSNAFDVGEETLVDYNVSSIARVEMSHRYRFAGAAAAVAAATKLSKYEERYNVDPATSGTNNKLVIAAIEDLGATGPAFIKFLRQQASKAAQQTNRRFEECFTFLLQTVSVTLNKAQAMLVDNCCIINGIRCGLEVDGNGSCFLEPDQVTLAPPTTVHLKVANLARHNVALNEQYYLKLTAEEMEEVLAEDMWREENRGKEALDKAKAAKNNEPKRNSSRSNSRSSSENSQPLSLSGSDSSPVSSRGSSSSSEGSDGGGSSDDDSGPVRTLIYAANNNSRQSSSRAHTFAAGNPQNSLPEGEEEADEEEIVRIKGGKAARNSAKKGKSVPAEQQASSKNHSLYDSSLQNDSSSSSDSSESPSAGVAVEKSERKKRENKKKAQNFESESSSSSAAPHIRSLPLITMQPPSRAAEQAADESLWPRNALLASNMALSNRDRGKAKSIHITSSHMPTNQVTSRRTTTSTAASDLQQSRLPEANLHNLLPNAQEKTVNDRARKGKP